jgi:hypothetical protein
LKHATNNIQQRYLQAKKKPTAQIAHLVFANAQSQRTKNQKSNFLPTLDPNYGKNVTLRIERNTKK